MRFVLLSEMHDLKYKLKRKIKIKCKIIVIGNWCRITCQTWYKDYYVVVRLGGDIAVLNWIFTQKKENLRLLRFSSIGEVCLILLVLS